MNRIEKLMEEVVKIPELAKFAELLSPWLELDDREYSLFQTMALINRRMRQDLISNEETETVQAVVRRWGDFEPVVRLVVLFIFQRIINRHTDGNVDFEQPPLAVPEYNS